MQGVTPRAAAKTLLYVSDLGTNLVNVYTYPNGSLITKLSGFGSVAGLCSSKTGYVFVVDGCAVDPATGNPAVTNLSSYLAGAV